MSELIGSNKSPGWTIEFDTYIPTLSEDANIQEALKIFYFGNKDVNQNSENLSIYKHLLNFDTRIDSLQSSLSSHADDNQTSENTHGIGDGSQVVGTNTAQTLTNKTFTSPKINENVNLTATSTELNVLDGITASTAELNILDNATITTEELNVLHNVLSGGVSQQELLYLDGVTSSIQTQLNSKANLSGPTTFTGSISLPATTTLDGKRIYIQQIQPTGTLNAGDVWIQIA